MDGMPQTPTPAHAKPRDHLWVLGVIAAFALFDVWGAWAQVGDKSGFAVGHTGTGWTLTVIVEAAAGYFLFAWFSAPGKRSRRFAMWSAFATLALSLIGQGASILAAHAKPPLWLAVFVKDLPVVVLALIAVLIHMRRLDREAAADAERERIEAEREARQASAEAARIAELEAALETGRAELAPLREALATAQADAEQAHARAESLAAKLAALKPNRTRTRKPNSGRRTGANSGAGADPNSGGRTHVPSDVDLRTEALGYYLANPDISGKELGEKCHRGERWGQLRRAEFLAAAPTGQDPQEP